MTTIQPLLPNKLDNPAIVYIVAGHGGFDPIQKEYVTNGKRATHKGAEMHQNGTYYEGWGNRIAADYLAAICREWGLIPIRIHQEIQDTTPDTRSNEIDKYVRKFGSALAKRSVLIELHSNAANGTAKGARIYTTTNNDNSDILESHIRKYIKQLEKQFETFVLGEYKQEKNYTLIAQSSIPAVLIERAFHDNQQAAELLVCPKFNQAQMFAVVLGIIGFLNK